MQNQTGPAATTLAACIEQNASGGYSLTGFACPACGETLLERKRACPRCAAIDTLQAVTLQRTGKVFSYTIVHRSFPGIATPFISAVVAIDGGGFLKGNLVGIEPRPALITPELPVAIEIEEIPSPAHPDQRLVRYVFRPLTQATAD